VKIALHGADHGGELRLDAGVGEQWFKDGHAFLHRAGGDEHFRHEDFVVFEFLANDAHAGNQALLDAFERFDILL
jgi:hypothetical protein